MGYYHKKMFLDAVMMIRIKRAYDSPSEDDGFRVLVDRLWPRGISKERAELDDWAREIAPSTELRQWFGHNPEKWSEFRKRYFRELDARKGQVDSLLEKSGGKTITLLFGARDKSHNNALALKEYLEKRLE
jgi:uncharacterized protein YeaO (DUF488 family)